MDKNFFNNEKFKEINDEVLNELNIFIEKIEGKKGNEALVYIMDFYNNILNSNIMSDREKEIIIQTIFSSLSSKDREKLQNILSFVDDLVK